jgi:hypothetical protein
MDRHDEYDWDHLTIRGDLTDSSAFAPPRLRGNDDADVSTALDTLDFDSSLSFLGDLDDVGVSIGARHSLPIDARQVHVPLLPDTSTDMGLPSRNINANGENISDGQPTDASAQPVEATRKAGPAATSRERQRQEMAYLRTQVVELETELSQLKSQSEALKEQVSEPGTWEKIAIRQNAAKQRATNENLKLRSLLEGQLKVARSLERILRKREVRIRYYGRLTWCTVLTHGCKRS